MRGIGLINEKEKVLNTQIIWWDTSDEFRETWEDESSKKI